MKGNLKWEQNSEQCIWLSTELNAIQEYQSKLPYSKAVTKSLINGQGLEMDLEEKGQEGLGVRYVDGPCRIGREWKIIALQVNAHQRTLCNHENVLCRHTAIGNIITHESRLLHSEIHHCTWTAPSK